MAPAANRLAELRWVLAPVRIAQHDAAWTQRITEVEQASGKRLGQRSDAVEAISLAQQQCIVLIGLEGLLATAFAAHHDQAAVADQLRRCEQLPKANQQLVVEFGHQVHRQFDACATEAQCCNQCICLQRGRTQVGDGGSMGDPG